MNSTWYLNDLLDLLDGGHCLCTTWMISMEFRSPLMSSISLCITRETIDAVGCTTGVFTHSAELELLKLVRMISMSSHFPVDLNCNISAIF